MMGSKIWGDPVFLLYCLPLRGVAEHLFKSFSLLFLRLCAFFVWLNAEDETKVQIGLEKESGGCETLRMRCLERWAWFPPPPHLVRQRAKRDESTITKCQRPPSWWISSTHWSKLLACHTCPNVTWSHYFWKCEVVPWLKQYWVV